MAKSAVKQARIFERSQAYRDNFDQINWGSADEKHKGENDKAKRIPTICPTCGCDCHRPKDR